MLNDELLWWLNAPLEQLTTNPPLNCHILRVFLLVLTFCRNHVREGQRKDQEGILLPIKELQEFCLLPG